MSELYEYGLFLLICACTVREAFLASSGPSSWQIQLLHLMRGHRAWLEHVHSARRDGTLGGLRLENRAGHLCVVGLGDCHEVQSVGEGVRLIEMLKDQIAGMFG